MRFAITGSSGLIGSALRHALAAAGHSVTRVVRSLAGIRPGERAVVWHPAEGAIEAAGLEDHDIVINLAGESLAGVWTAAKKRRIRESRVRATTLIAETVAGLRSPPGVLISASGFNYYGDRDPSAVVTEASPPGAGFLPEVVVEWEASTRAAEQAGIRVVHTRFGTVLSPDGGLLQVLLPLFRLGLGAKFGGGEQPWPWIALPEIPPAMLHVIQSTGIAGPVNFVAPEAVTNEQFTKSLAAVVGRPAPFALPAFAARLAPGRMADEMLLGGARVVPEKLLASGYSFRYPQLEQALRAILR